MFLAVDGGATKTVCAVLDPETLEIRGVGISGSSNFKNVGVERAKANIREAMGEALRMAGSDGAKAYLFGLAGAGDAASATLIVRGFIEEILGGRGFILTNDGVQGYTLANLEEEGVVFAAGTGSVGYYRIGGELKRIGGWGWFSGDEGSAFWIARRALNKATRSFDGIEPKSGLVRAVESYFGVEFREAIAKVHMEHPVDLIARFAPEVSKLADEGDQLALQVIREAAGEIATILRAMESKFEREVRKSVVGGVTSSRPLREEVKRLVPSVEFFRGYHVVVGGLLSLLKAQGYEVSHSLRDRLVMQLEQRIRELPPEKLRRFLFI
jgi:N-acetylglucosamine kinase